jgi:hypothetical protein
MIEKIVIDYLESALSVPVYAEVPEANTGAFVVVEKVGSSRTNYLDAATIAVQSYGDTLVDAAKLNQTAKGLMLEIVNLEQVSAVRLNSDYNFTDTETKRYRYQALFVITYYEN